MPNATLEPHPDADKAPRKANRPKVSRFDPRDRLTDEECVTLMVAAQPLMDGVAYAARHALTAAILDRKVDRRGRLLIALDTWADVAHMPLGTIRKAIDALVAAGLLERTERWSGKGKQLANRYRVTFAADLLPPPRRAPAGQLTIAHAAASAAQEPQDAPPAPAQGYSPEPVDAPADRPGEGAQDGQAQGAQIGHPVSLKRAKNNGSTCAADGPQVAIGEDGQELAALIDWAVAQADGIDPPTTRQHRLLNTAWLAEPEVIAAHAWSASRNSRNLLAVLLYRLEKGRATEQTAGSWSQVVDRWEAAGSPRPWLDGEGPAPADDDDDAVWTGPPVELDASDRTPSPSPWTGSSRHDPIAEDTAPIVNARIRELIEGRGQEPATTDPTALRAQQEVAPL